jgi:hypothetical protein
MKSMTFSKWTQSEEQSDNFVKIFTFVNMGDIETSYCMTAAINLCLPTPEPQHEQVETPTMPSRTVFA